MFMGDRWLKYKCQSNYLTQMSPRNIILCDVNEIKSDGSVRFLMQISLEIIRVNQYPDYSIWTYVSKKNGAPNDNKILCAEHRFRL